jgi:hypothetical protein
MYLGMLGGLAVGVLAGLVIAVDTFCSMAGYESYAASLGVFAVLAGALIGLLGGLVIGVLNGLVLVSLSGTVLLRSRAGVNRNRVTAVVVLITGLTGFVILHLLIGRTGGLFTYPLAFAGALLSIPLSRRLPPLPL